MQTKRLLTLPEFPFKESFLKFYKDTGIDFYFVGGFVRDILLNRNIKDIDIVAEGIDYNECAKILNRYIKGSIIPFKDNIRITKNDLIIDVSKLRGDKIVDDLNKRDFTINNLAYHFDKGLIGNYKDLEDNVIRIAYNDAFKDDPLRVLRGYRFVSQLGFIIEDNTRSLMLEFTPYLLEIPSERILTELNAIFLGDHFIKSLELIIQDKLFLTLFPSMKKLENLYGGIYHIEDVLPHTYSVVKEIHSRIQHFSDHDKIILILSALLHDTGKGDERYKDTPGKFVGHEEISAQLAELELKRLSYPNKVIKEVTLLVKKHGVIRKYATNVAKDSTVLKFIYENLHILEKLIILSIADAHSKNRCDISFHKMIEKIEHLKTKIDLSKKSLIDGNYLIKLGVEKSPILGKLLNDIHFRLATGIIKTKEEVEKYIKMKLSEKTIAYNKKALKNSKKL
jgi:tRNA nucleotidyltransferase/poly(A) polymerase